MRENQEQESNLGVSREELSYLDTVERVLEDRLEDVREELEEGVRDIKQMNEYYWQNYTEMDEYGYEDFDNRQALLHREQSNQELQDRIRRLGKMQDSPYFGRVDFQYEGESFSEKHYIGIGNLSGNQGGMPLVFDWRAPVSGLFYDFEKGEAFYDAPQGRIAGEVTSKRQYKIRRGRMIYAVESDLKIDDDILQEELSKNGDVRLKNIVRTIQREQNQIIRNTQDRILVVQGAAGSGKTSIALHRIAYLLYHDRKHLKASDILILSPNRVFSNYISQILPELGEENIREMSFDFFAWKELKGVAANCEECYDRIERQLAKARRVSCEVRESRATESDAEGCGAAGHEDCRTDKQSRVFVEEINGFLLKQEDELVRFSDVSYKNLQKTARELSELFYFKFPEIPLLRRMESVMEYAVDEAETLAGKDFDEADRFVIRGIFDQMYETKDIYRIYNMFLTEIGEEPLPDVPVSERTVPYEDVYPLLYMKYMLEGVGGGQRIRHLVIDEMQDYSYLQYLILAKLFPCRMTIVGDRCQTMQETQRDVMKFLPGVLGKDIRMLSIRKSYRSTMEIAAYAQTLIEGEPVENLGRSGKGPECLTAAGLAEAMALAAERICLEDRETAQTAKAKGEAKAAAEGAARETEKRVDGQREVRRFETCAVICMTMEEAREAYRCLEAAMKSQGTDPASRLMLVDRESEEFRAGVVVTAFYLAKGLEFDQVFVCSRAHDDAPIFRQAKYICATRALHELYMIELQEV